LTCALRRSKRRGTGQHPRAPSGGEALSQHEVAQFKTVLVFLGAEYARRGWVQQYHIGALRNNNLRQFKLGPDVGFDSINDRPLAEELSNC
jgi:glucuronate isomerase